MREQFAITLCLAAGDVKFVERCRLPASLHRSLMADASQEPGTSMGKDFSTRKK
jgi:hypothetical protein